MGLRLDIIDNIIRFFKDDYKVGIEKQSKLPVIYINPDRINLSLVDIATKKEDKELLAQQIARQVDEQHPGLSLKLTTDQLVFILKQSLSLSPFAGEVRKDLGVCITKQPLPDSFKRETILKDMGITKIFREDSLKPLQGSTAIWRQLLGEHEGEHCNHTTLILSNKNVELNVLESETLSDRAALRTLHATGHYDIAESWKHIRTIAAANGDYKHATSIFFDQEKFEGVTKEHLEAAQKFRGTMNSAVAAELHVDKYIADKLRTEDPQKFVKIVANALAHGKIPVPEHMSLPEQYARIAKEMGITTIRLKELESNEPDKVYKIYNRLEAEGAFLKAGDNNPHIKTYINQYIKAVQFLCVPDTTPILKPEPKTGTTHKDRNVLNNVEQINAPATVSVDLHSGEHGAMKISGMSAPAYFALQATAKQQPAPENTPEATPTAQTNNARRPITVTGPTA